MNHLEATRRFLELKDLDEVLSECRSLHQMGYRRMGKWSLAQICRHLRMTFDSSIDGYPLWMSFFAPLRPFIRRMMLPRLLRGDSPKGIPTAPMFAPQRTWMMRRKSKFLLQAFIGFKTTKATSNRTRVSAAWTANK